MYTSGHLQNAPPNPEPETNGRQKHKTITWYGGWYLPIIIFFDISNALQLQRITRTLYTTFY